ncbi:MAG TPA: LuxR C-terminal-related transcriptional regulator [Solirubrobacterales bacterium]
MPAEEKIPQKSLVAGVDLDRPSLGGLVERRRLIDRLEGGTPSLVLLNAPTGYGKSVLLAQWAARDPRPFASIVLGDAHNDPVLLLGEVVDALNRIEPLPAGVTSALTVPDPDLERVVLPRLGQAIEARETAVVLIFDELEHVESPQSLLVIRTLVEHARGGTQIAVATRVDPALPLGRLRANRLLSEVGRAELAMTKPECAMLLSGIGVELNQRELDALIERTEGWPAALYLAGMALLDETDMGAAISRFAGDDRIVADYIRDEFLTVISPRRLDLLRRISILDRFNGDLCDAVLERSGSATALRDMLHGNMLLLSLDRKDEWFRLHTLLAGMLRGELRRAEPEKEPELHLRASSWWAEQGDSDRAIEHAIAAKAYERAGELLWAGVPEYNSRGRVATVERWLQRLGVERLSSYPTLSLTAAQGCLARGEGSMTEYWIAVSRRLLEGMRSPRKAPLVAGLALTEAGLARDGLIAMSERAAEAAEVMPDESPWLSMCCLVDGTSLLLRGHPDEARERLSEGARRGAVGGPHIQVLCLTQLSLLAIEEPDWQVAEMLASQARAQIERSGLGDYTTAALAFAVSAFVRSHRGMADEAAADLRTGVQLMRRLDEFAAWYETQTRIVLARAAVRLDEVGLAQDLLDEARRLIWLTPEATLLADWLSEAELEAERISAAAVRDLTPAELRILGSLPTHHSFPQIAAQAHVSPNTVKTQAQAVYRKLGVSSRREAVERAREIGLLREEERASGSNAEL